MDRITGSSLPRHDSVSLIDPQKEWESSPLDIGDGRTGVEAGGDAFTGAGAGGDGRWAVSGKCEGTVVTDGNAGCRTDTGAIVATMADILSSFLSKSRILLGVCPSILGFAGLLRATCSTHSTRAFWHLVHVLCRGCGKVPEKRTFGIQKLCLREHTELCAYDLLKLEGARAVWLVPYSARTQTRCLISLLLLPWRQWSCEVWETPKNRSSPRAPRAPACVGKPVRSYAKISGHAPGAEERLTQALR